MSTQIKDIKYIKRDFLSIAWAMPHGWDFGAMGVPRESKQKFEHRHRANQIHGDDENNRMQVDCSPYGQTGDHRVKSKGQISLNFSYKVNYKYFIPNFVCVPKNKNKNRKHTERNVHAVAWVMPQGWDLGVLGVKIFSVGICNCAPSTARSSWS